MRMRRATLWALFGLGGSLLTSAVAQAQEARPVVGDTWLRDSRFRGGPGIQTDRWNIQPGVAASFGYDSNLYLRSDNPGGTGPGSAAAERVSDAFKLSITPFISIDPRVGQTPQSYALSGYAALSYYEFFKGTKSQDGDDISGNRNIGALASGKLTIAPGQRWSGDLHTGVVRSIQPGGYGDPNASFNRTVPSVGAGVQWAPGGGLFAWRLGYDLTYSYFEADAYKSFNNFAHTVGSTATWRFLPRTSIFSDSKVTLLRYTSGNTTQSDGDAVSTRVGVNGLVTNAFGFLVAGGWAATVFKNADDFDSFIAQAEARFYLTAPPRKEDEPGLYPTTITVGYTRDWTQSYIGNFYQRDRGYANLSYFFNGVVLANVGGGVARIHFPSTAYVGGATGSRAGAFNNTAVDASFFLEYRVTRNIGINGTATYTQMISDTILPTTPAATPAGQAGTGDDQRYKRFEAALGVRYLFLARN